MLGGGIAGAKCAEELLRCLRDPEKDDDDVNDDDAVILVEKSDVRKLTFRRGEGQRLERKMDVETRRSTTRSRREACKERRRVKVDGDAQTVTVRLNEKTKKKKSRVWMMMTTNLMTMILCD